MFERLFRGSLSWDPAVIGQRMCWPQRRVGQGQRWRQYRFGSGFGRGWTIDE